MEKTAHWSVYLYHGSSNSAHGFLLHRQSEPSLQLVAETV
ncbi:Uncharacterised protein [Vibrio cholerae]|uniref:Uncharacterized protein n=1 Tax=Vibrio cholerae TaxID=666 RepID=A0A655ZW93_VIBCL|nr:Uncharacterised protein [Vibrio cholerae]